MVFVVGLVGVLFFVRFFSEVQLDDVSSEISCDVDLLEEADVYYVIPSFEGVNISGEWCGQVLSSGKELAMHGVYHEFEEFGVYRDEDYVGVGVGIFERCFGYVPERFKPPQIVFASENDWIREEFEVDLFWNQVFHKVYHCEDSGFFPNWVVRIF